MSRYDYWGYYKPAKPKAVRNGIKTKKQRGTIGETWWSKRWIAVLNSFNMGARLSRGRSYARKGQVASLTITTTGVKAKVQGTRARPYTVKISLGTISDEDWELVLDVMANRAIFAAKLLAGEMPKNIEEAFEEAGVSLFPKSKRELVTDCSCPDWANPCKHIAAVYFILAERFDDDPFLIFKLRGRTKKQIMGTLTEKRACAHEEVEEDRTSEGVEPSIETTAELESYLPTPPLEECIASYWETKEPLSNFILTIDPPEIDHALLRRLGRAPFTLRGDDIKECLKRGYSLASQAALDLSQRESIHDQ